MKLFWVLIGIVVLCQDEPNIIEAEQPKDVELIDEPEIVATESVPQDYQVNEEEAIPEASGSVEEEEEDEELIIRKRKFKETLDLIMPLFGLRDQDEDEYSDEQTQSDEYQQIDQADIEINEEIDNILKDDSIMIEWDSMMQDFQPEDMLQFEIGAGQTEVLYEYISRSTTVRGAYFIPMFKLDQKIDFLIKTEKNEIVYSKERVQEGIFRVDVPTAGEYKFVFSNKKSKVAQIVTFALDVHNSTREHLQLSDLDPIEMRIENIHIAMRDNYFESKFAQQRQDQGYQMLYETNQKLLLFSIIEVLGICGVTFWQVFYIKRILGNQRII